MRRLRLGLCALAASVAIAVVAAGWSSEVPGISGDEAAEAVLAAFEGAGLSAVIEGRPTPSSYASSTRPVVEVWTVRARVRSQPVAVLVARAGAQPVQIDDRGPSGTEYVLSDVEYQRVAGRIDDPALDRLLRRNITLTLAAALVVMTAIAVAFVPDRRSEEHP